MTRHAIMHTAAVSRQMTIGKVEAIDETLFDVTPVGFNNTIRWNLGHIITVMDSLLFKRVAQTSKLPESYYDLFKGGTKPADWTVTPPSKSELIERLKQQLDEVQAAFNERVNESLPAPVQIRAYSFETIGELVGFAVIHEGLHATTISDQLKLINLHQS